MLKKKKIIVIVSVLTDKTAAVSKKFFVPLEDSQSSHIHSLYVHGVEIMNILCLPSFLPQVMCWGVFLMSNVTLKYEEHWETELLQWDFIYNFIPVLLNCFSASWFDMTSASCLTVLPENISHLNQQFLGIW